MINMHRLTTSDFVQIYKFLQDNNIKLLISDLNGVLDNYYDIKWNYLRELLGSNLINHFPELYVYIEKRYIANNAISIEQAIKEYFLKSKLSISTEQQLLLDKGMGLPTITTEAKRFLDSVYLPFVIFTSMTSDKAKKVLMNSTYEIVGSDINLDKKPSILLLKTIIEKYKIKPSESCILGDGLIDDLMPASLIGAHTILVSPYSEILING